jgi:hypothetical protein
MQPIPLDLLTLRGFADPPTRIGGIFLPSCGEKGVAGRGRSFGLPDVVASIFPFNDVQEAYPYTIHHNGRSGGLYTLFAESAQLRSEWKIKLEETMGLREVVEEPNRPFEVETLSVNTFPVPTLLESGKRLLDNDGSFTGKVTCSVPFSMHSGSLSGSLCLLWGCSYPRWA